MTKKEMALLAVNVLKERYPNAICSLQYTDPVQLLIATRLSAQCTDARVNLVTPALFARFPTLHAFADASPAEVEDYIHSCGFFRMKAQNIVDMTAMLRDVYHGVVPDTIEELIKLPGVGRKTANLIVGDIYGKPAIVTDTHCIRITNRWGLCATKDPYKVELALKKLLPPAESNSFCHRLVLFGREICTARSPHCAACPFMIVCGEAALSSKKSDKTDK